MIQKVRKILVEFLVLTLCVPMNTVFAEGTNEYSKEAQSISLQDDSQKEEKFENEDLQVPTESVTGENIDDSGNVDFPQEPEVPSPEWTRGWNFYEGNWYYAKEENTLYFGWIYLNSKWYYLDGENAGIMAYDVVRKIGDNYYTFDGSGAMQTGWVLRPEGWYYADNSGACAIGWRYIRGVWYYLDGFNTEHPGLMAENCTRNIGGSNYYFAAGGAMQTGWVHYTEGWYYADASGAQAIGWRKIGNVWYYLDGDNKEYPGLMAENCTRIINGSTYFFAIGGAMQAGWVHYTEGWYYAEPSGAQATGWRKVNGVWYYLDGDNAEYPGLMLSDCSKEINGNTYTFRVSGAMAMGWYQNGNDWYYYDASGLITSGWRSIKGNWYYLDPADNNKMVNGGWRLIGNSWYFFYGNGAMATNWLVLNGEWYWLSDDGSMKTGWQIAGNAWYYMYTKNDVHGGSEGAMAMNTVIDGYVVHEDGAYIRSRNKLGWQNPAGYPQVSSLTVMLPSYCTGYFTYVTPSRISIYASRQECVDAFIARAYEYLGTKYIEPWSSYPGDAVDCSGFVLQCLYATGMDLGIYNPYNHRWIASQTYNSMNWYNNNTFMPVSTNSLQRGDLVYYRGHVAIYLGNGQIIDSWPGQGVSVKPIGSRGAVIGAARPYV